METVVISSLPPLLLVGIPEISMSGPSSVLPITSTVCPGRQVTKGTGVTARATASRKNSTVATIDTVFRDNLSPLLVCPCQVTASLPSRHQEPGHPEFPCLMRLNGLR